MLYITFSYNDPNTNATNAINIPIFKFLEAFAATSLSCDFNMIIAE